MNLTIHRGAAEIGGSCVEIATSRTRIIFDAGLPLDDARKDELPDVPGLFRTGPGIDAIFLSHSHPDHSGLLCRTNSPIPVYLSRGCSKMLMASSLYAGQPGLPRARQHITKSAVPVTVGDIVVTPFDVDHSVFGACALLVEADGKRVLYSGDLRLHGRKPGMADRLIRHIKNNPLDVLLMEGTHVGSRRKAGLTESELEEVLTRRFMQATSLALGFFSPQNLDRLVSFYRAARRSDRVFVIDRYTAAIMHLLHTDVRIPLPSREAGMRVYFNRVGRKVPKIERNFADSGISLDQILREPQLYVMVSRPSMIQEDFASQLPIATTGIYSMWSGYLSKPEWQDVAEVIRKTGGDFLEYHASGHIRIGDLLSFVTHIAPTRVFPIHSRCPSAFKKLFSAAAVVEDSISVCV